MRLHLPLFTAFAILLAGCSTTQTVTLGKASHDKPIQSVAQVPNEGNSAEMSTHLTAALQAQGLTVKPALPAGTSRSAEADALVSYVDVWRWDLVMYLKTLTVKVHDAASGDLLAMGEWNDSPMHGFRDAKVVMNGLVAEVLGKIRGNTKPADAK